MVLKLFSRVSLGFGIKNRFMLNNLVDRPFELNYFCRHSARNCIGWNVFRDNRAGGHNCATTYRNTRQKSYIATYPYIFFNYDILIESCRFILFIDVGYEFTDDVCMISCMDCQSLGYSAVSFADKFSINGRNPCVACQIAALI